jgi:hypothetical protein
MVITITLTDESMSEGDFSRRVYLSLVCGRITNIIGSVAQPVRAPAS